MPDNEKIQEANLIRLSNFTKALIQTLKSIKQRSRPDDLSQLSVSQTVSFFALVYERVRNAVEFREDHLILRASIERIIKRRLSLNPEGKGEGENLLRELLWARYFDNGSLGGEDVAKAQSVIDKYILLRKQIVSGREAEMQQYLNQFLLDLLTCELEEMLKPASAAKHSNYTFFIYQVLRAKVKIEGLTEQQKDSFFLAAIEKVYGKSDKPYQRYHLFAIFYKTLQQYTTEELKTLGSKLPAIFKKIDDIIMSPYVENLSKFVRKQLPPFLIIFELINNKFSGVEMIFSDKDKLWSEVDTTCRDKYQQLGTRVRNLAVKSFIYILLTKMIFALILEYPLSLYIYKEVNLISIGINSIFPPILMVLILAFFRVPGESNTKKIYQRIIEIVDADKTFETQIAYMPKKPLVRRPSLIFGFTVFYSITFIVTLMVIYEILILLNFNLISQFIFLFFVSVVTFFSYRIRQIVKELRLDDKESIFTPVIDFFFMPILSLGKFFSQEIARLNFFIFIFDFLIEAPFKLVFEIVEEWISFVKKRKEEIV
ncbi:hypothetical protein HY041_00160 [Candidatus Roizmanbacteria bacterium]|nr:hypothetical protein [Candidatus Roizmanbacteria bacterium]